jgi:N-acetylmuramoyl-L-alanine amidase
MSDRRGISTTLGVAVMALAVSCSSSQPQSVSGSANAVSLTARRASTAVAERTTTSTATTPRASSPPLTGKVVGIDPGHNGNNYTDPAYIDHLVYNGREQEACDTTGTQTDAGYTEAAFNFNVARFLASDLHREGATVVLTRTTNSGVGPCITRRAEILNRAHSDVAIDIHADGGPPTGRGFAVLEPVPDGPNDRVIGASRRFGLDVRERFRDVTGIPQSTYDGSNAIAPRDNLAGLNLTTVPKVLIECANMRNAKDAALLARDSFQRLAARALAEAITEYLT